MTAPDCPRCPTRQPLFLDSETGTVTCSGCRGPVGLPPLAEGSAFPAVVVMAALVLAAVVVVVAAGAGLR